MKNKFAVAVILTSLITFATPHLSAHEVKEDAILKKVGFDQKLDSTLPLAAPFTDDDGKLVNLGDYFGKKPVILTLVYFECPMLCTLSLNELVKSLRALSFDVGNQFDVLTVSFDAKEKFNLAAKKKKTYLEEYNRAGAEKGWHFLTGDQTSIDQLTSAVGFHYAWDPQSKQFAHPVGIIIITPQGKISRYFFDVEYSTLDIKIALMEAAQGKIGSPLEKAIFYCYHYDPATGKYGFAILRIMQLSGLITVLLLAIFIFVMLKREKRTPHA